jgi:O-acetyl-ADP-ribose deacetylase (regulator of RNase III)
MRGAAMISYTTGGILNADVEALVNTVNCVGIMGRGIALQFKNMFPENFEDYAAACARDDVQPGRMFVHDTHALTNPRYIINFPTKRHWRGKSRIEDIDSGLLALREEIVRRGIRSIAIPPLGSGLGGLDWSVVKPRIVKALAGLDQVDIRIYEPKGAPEASAMVRRQEVPKMTPGRAALVVLMQRYVGGLMDPQAPLLSPRSRRAAAPPVPQGALRPLCRESDPSSADRRRPFHLGLRRWW